MNGVRRKIRHRFASAVVATLLVAAGAGCSSGAAAGPKACADSVVIVNGSCTPTGLRGDPMTPPLQEPDIVMTDTHGTRYDLQAATPGKTVLMYFGYTHCPDLCPLLMADTAAAIRQVPPAVRQQVRVVFVTVDPRRDTLPVLGKWLRKFSPHFIGLRAPIRQVIAAQKSLGLPVSHVRPHSKHGYTVQHSAELIAFTPDHESHIVYTDGPSTISDIAHDLPQIVADRAWH
jgi:protein SCO1/2